MADLSPTVYVASKTRHAPMWLALRARGIRIISTWIDEAGSGQSACLRDLARRCVAEPAAADATLLYAEPGDILKGALVEVGVALGAGRPVVSVGLPSDWSALASHPLWTRATSLEDALSLIEGLTKSI